MYEPMVLPQLNKSVSSTQFLFRKQLVPFATVNAIDDAICISYTFTQKNKRH